MSGNGNETHYLYIGKSDNQLLFRGIHGVQGCDITVLNMQNPTTIYFTFSLTWMQNLFLHRKGQTENGEIKDRGKKSGVNYHIFRPITRVLSIQKGSEIIKNEHARYTLERFPTDNARVICTKKGIGKYGIMY